MANEKKPYTINDTLFYVLSLRFHKPQLVQPLLLCYFDLLKIISDLLSDSRDTWFPSTVFRPNSSHIFSEMEIWQDLLDLIGLKYYGLTQFHEYFNEFCTILNSILWAMQNFQPNGDFRHISTNFIHRNLNEIFWKQNFNLIGASLLPRILVFENNNLPGFAKFNSFK